MPHPDFQAAIERLATAEARAEQNRIREEIWARWGTKGAVFITDMADFSKTVRYRGITWFLAMIHRCRGVVTPIVEHHDGLILKYETDNCFAFFEDAADAIRAAIAVTEALRLDNLDRAPEDHVNLGIGIDYGPLLLIDDLDFYGDPVNTGSKLGEDMADNREIFVSERALEASGLEIDGLVHRSKRISDIDIAYVEIPVARDA